MACGSCGGSFSAVRVERSNSGSRPSIATFKQVTPLRPQSVVSRKIGPANHLDKRQ